jgi:hypothetical protein
MASLFAKMAAQAKEAVAAKAKEAATSAATRAKEQIVGPTAETNVKEQVTNNVQNVGADPNVNPFAKNNPAPPPQKPEVPKEPVTNRHPEHKTIDPEVFTKLDCPTTPNTRSTVFVGDDKPDGARYEPYSEHYSGECTYINPDRD